MRLLFQLSQNHRFSNGLAGQAVVSLFILHFLGKGKIFYLKVFGSLKMYLSYRINVREFCPFSNKFIKIIKNG